MLCIRTPPIPLLVPSHLAIKRLYTQNDHFLELTPCPAQAESRLHSSYCPGSPPQSLRSEGIAWKKPGRAFLGSSSESFTNSDRVEADCGSISGCCQRLRVPRAGSFDYVGDFAIPGSSRQSHPDFSHEELKITAWMAHRSWGTGNALLSTVVDHRRPCIHMSIHMRDAMTRHRLPVSFAVDRLIYTQANHQK
jgi:hypothetical protein